MHKLIIDVLIIDRIICTRQPQVALWKEINILLLGEEYPHSDVELALIHQEGLLDILLNNEAIEFNSWFSGSVAPVLLVCLGSCFLLSCF